MTDPVERDPGDLTEEPDEDDDGFVLAPDTDPVPQHGEPADG